MAREKRTARKSTGRPESDPMQRRMRDLETIKTKRSSLGPSTSSRFVEQSHREGPSGRQRTPLYPIFGNNGRGKNLPPAVNKAVKHKAKPPPKQMDNLQGLKSKLTSEVGLQMPRAPFHRIVRDITQKIEGTRGLRYQMAALMALQEATEAYLVNLFADANLLTLHAKRVTLFPRDLILRLRLLVQGR